MPHPLKPLALAAALALGLPAAAHAAPPANDAPAGATPFTAVTAENGTVADRQGLADVSEATPDAGAPRCLGASSFNRTVWFRVPAASTPQLVRVEATGPSGASADVPDLAAYVQNGPAPLTAEPQACDGATADGGAKDVDEASAVELRVPAGRDVLIQAGRSGENTERIVLDLHTEALALPSPLGDLATAAPTIARDANVAVPLGGALLTEEDPAEPACAASGTVWRKVNAKRDGTYTVTATGAAVGALTAFVGKTPTADNALSCVDRAAAAAPLSLAVPAKRKDVIWVRLGTDTEAKDATATLKVASPPPVARFGLTLLGSRKVAKLKRLRAQLSVNGAAVSAVVVRLQRKVGKAYVTVAVGKLQGTVRSGKKATLTLKRSRKLRRGSYRLTVVARPVEAPKLVARGTGKTVRLR